MKVHQAVLRLIGKKGWRQMPWMRLPFGLIVIVIVMATVLSVSSLKADDLFNRIEVRVNQAVEGKKRFPLVDLTDLVTPFVPVGTSLVDATATLEELGFTLVPAPRAIQPGFDERYVASTRSRSHNLVIS